VPRRANFYKNTIKIIIIGWFYTEKYQNVNFYTPKYIFVRGGGLGAPEGPERLERLREYKYIINK
jgi:hypothetical protein